MKAIRWSGFLAFSIFLIILAGGAWLFAETITKSIAESTLTDLNGAQVNIDSVNISYAPLSLTVNNIQVTDPQRPMVNMLQLGRARFALSFSDLLMKKLIIEDMALNKIQIDTPRKKSGAIKKTVKTRLAKSKSEDSILDFTMPDIDLPDVDELISKEELHSEKLITDLDNDLQQTQDKWKTISDDLQNKQRWESYQQRYNKIKIDLKGNTAQKLAAVKNAKLLRNDLKNEANKIQQARKQFSEDNKRLSEKFKAVKTSPRDDIRRIKEKYKLDDLSTQNISQLLFGEKAAEYIRLAEKWYGRIKPYIEDSPEEIAEKQAKQRRQGQNIKFREYNPKPDFYVRKASIDAEIPRGQFTGRITEISSDQSINKKPMQITLKGMNLRHRESESINAEFNYISKKQGYSQLNYNIKSYQLEDFKVSGSSKLPLTMNKGLMSLKLESRLANKRITGSGQFTFDKVSFTSKEKTNGSSFSSMMASSFSSINKFNINANFSGSLHDLDLDLKSDLDNQLGDQLKAQLKQRGQQFENKLKARIDAKLEQPLARLNDKRQRLDQLKADIDNREKELKQQLADIEDQIKQASNSKVDKKKEELLNKLKSKFKL